MTRPEKALLALAAVLLLAALGLCSNTTAPQGSWTEGEIPWPQLLWQFKQMIAPPLALVGLASAVGILFLRAAQWRAVSEPPVQHARQEPVQLPDQNGAANPPRG
jgi:hypothetical protein